MRHGPTQRSFWGSTVVKNLSANAGTTGLIPGPGRSPGGGNGTPLRYSCLGNPMDRGAWYSPWGCKELDTTGRLNMHTHVQYNQKVTATIWLLKWKIRCLHVESNKRRNTPIELEQNLLTHLRGKNLSSAGLGLCCLIFVSVDSNFTVLKHPAFPFLGRELVNGSLCFPLSTLSGNVAFFTFSMIGFLMHWYRTVGMKFFFTLGNISWC